MRLYIKIILLVVLVTLFIGSISVILVNQLMYSALEDEMKKRCIDITQAISEHITENVINGEVIPTREILRKLVQQTDDIEFAYVVGFDGNMFAHTFEKGFPRILAKKLYEIISKDAPELDRYFTEEGSILTVGYPLIDGMLAHIHIGMSESNMHNQIRKLRNRIMVFTLIVIFFGILLAAFFSFRITVPLKRLADSMHAFGKGEKKEDIEFHSGGKEVKELTQSFKQMIIDRKQAEERISHLNLVLRSLRDVNQLITKEKNRDVLLQESCKILTRGKGYGSVWIALFDENHKFDFATESGIGENFQLLISEQKKGKLSYCVKKALIQPEVLLIENPEIECTDCPVSVEYEGRSAIAVRLEYNKKVYGFLCVRIEKKYLADEEMLDLFREVTGDIAFALYRLELEAAHKQAEESLRQSEKRYRTLVEGAGQPIFTMNRDGVFLFMNETAADSLGGQPDDFVDKTMWDIFPKNTAKLQMSNITRTIESGESLVVESESVIQGERRWYNVRMHPLRNISGEIDSVLVITLDITERKRAEEQIKKDLEIKNILLQEVHHRVKNNMQIISSLLKLQSAHIKDKKALELFQNSRDRIKTMSLLHDALYRSKDLDNIDFADYVTKLTTQIFNSYGTNSNFIKFNINVKGIMLDISTAIPCGLIINELVSNSLKYAFPEGRKGEVSISFTYKNQVNTLCVKDNGIGFPGKIDLVNSPTLGFLLVNSLTKQLDGTLKLEKVKGTSFKIAFKKTELKTYGKV